MQDLTLIVFMFTAYTSIVSGSNLVIRFSRKDTPIKHLISALIAGKT